MRASHLGVTNLWRGLTAGLTCVALGVFFASGGCDDGGGEDPPNDPLPVTSYWPNFRGPRGLGVSEDTATPTSWQWVSAADHPGIKWRSSVPLKGASSPIVWENKVFVTCASVSTRRVICYNAADGTQAWNKTVTTGSPAQAVAYNDQMYAGPTPATDGTYVYAMFGNGDLVCFDFAGTEQWKRNLGEAAASDAGYASSLIAYSGKLIVQYDQEEVTGSWPLESRSKLLFIDPQDGSTSWEHTSAQRQSFLSLASPAIVRSGGMELLVTCASPYALAQRATTGAEVWRLDCGLSGYAIPSPAYAGGRVIAAAEYSTVRGIGGGHEDWAYDGNAVDCASPVGKDNLLFLLTDSGTLTCVDATDGTEHWAEQEIFGSSATAWAAPVIAGNKLYAMNDKGQTYVIEVSSAAYNKLGEGSLASGEIDCWSAPAISEGHIYIRTPSYLYCIGN